MFDYLVDNGVSPREVDARGWNLYHYMCMSGSMGSEKLLAHALEKLPQDVSEAMLTQQSKGDMETVSSNRLCVLML